MKIVFSDEAGIDNDAKAPNVVVAAIMLNLDRHCPVLFEHIETAIRSQKRNSALYELRGSRLIRDLRRAKRDPSERNLKLERQASLIWGACLIALFQHGVPVFVHAINKAGYRSLWTRHASSFAGISPYMAAFSQCLREVDSYVRTESPNERALWILDKTRMHEANLKDALTSIREIQQIDLAGPFPASESPEPHFSNIADTIYFGDSRHSRALQLANLCAATTSLYLQNEPLATPFIRMLNPHGPTPFGIPLVS